LPLPERRPRLLLPVARARAAGLLLEVAEAIVQAEHGSGHLLGVVEIPPERSMVSNLTVARRYRTLLQRISSLRRGGLGVQVRVAASTAQGVREAVYENGTDLIVVEWPRSGGGKPNRSLDDLIADPPADLLLVRSGSERPELMREGPSVLVPVRGGESARLALRVALALAGRLGRVTAMHVYDPRQELSAREQEAERFRSLVSGLAGATPALVEVESANASAVIAAQARKHDVTVLGAYAEAARSPVVVGSRLAATVRRLPGTVIVAKSSSMAPALLDVEMPTPATPVPADLPHLVDRWFAENTFHSREFRDLDRLVELKRSQGLTISLGLPTLNEEASIGRIVRVLREELVERHPLLDEMVVIDSGSTDRTAAIAGELGVPVVQHRDILPELSSFAGKGEALWKSLHHLTGDIVVWCDTDITNIHPQFVYGVLGPLLSDPRIGFVKGFYRRPLDFGGELQAAGGGRVTELAARPLINLFYPELSGLVQPLSGEYAGRRELLERLPFFTGYGVEIGHLIDVLESFGLNRIGQVDLGVRIHRNQSLLDLSKMAFAILQVALKRLGDRHRIHLLEEVNRSMKLIRYNNDRFFVDVKEIEDLERPPMVTIPGYLARRWDLAVQATLGAEQEERGGAGQAEDAAEGQGGRRAEEGPEQPGDQAGHQVAHAVDPVQQAEGGAGHAGRHETAGQSALQGLDDGLVDAHGDGHERHPARTVRNGRHQAGHGEDRVAAGQHRTPAHPVGQPARRKGGRGADGVGGEKEEHRSRRRRGGPQLGSQQLSGAQGEEGGGEVPGSENGDRTQIPPVGPG
jgi:glucosyl-3-phosphoglycerate synthase